MPGSAHLEIPVSMRESPFVGQLRPNESVMGELMQGLDVLQAGDQVLAGLQQDIQQAVASADIKAVRAACEHYVQLWYNTPSAL